MSLNVGLEPSWRFEVAGTKVGIGLPLDWGLSVDDYYFNSAGDHQTLGYFSIALTSSVSLPVPAECGRWFLNTSLQSPACAP